VALAATAKTAALLFTMNVYDCDVFQKKRGAEAAQLASAAFAHPGDGESAAAEQ
jgi:hypothetical protein